MSSLAAVLAVLGAARSVAGLVRAVALRRRARARLAAVEPGGAAPLPPPGPLTRLGAAVLRRVVPLAPPTEPAAARWVAVGVVCLALAPLVPAALVPGGAFLAAGWRRAHRAPPGDDPLDSLPDVLDLLGVAARAGLPALTAIGAVAGRAPPPWDHLLGAVHRRTDRGEPLWSALDGLVDGAGEPAHRLVHVLRSSAADGGDLARDLAHLADDARERRRRRAEQHARRVPVQLLAPLVTCSLPAFALLTVVPSAANAIGAIHL